MGKHHYYSSEENEWLLNNSCDKGTKEILKEFNELFGANIGITQLRSNLARLNVHVGFSTIYTKQQNEWLKTNYKKYDLNSLTKKFNELFGTELTSSQLRSHSNTILGLRKVPKIKRHYFTTSEKEWLKNNYPILGGNELEKAYEVEFGEFISVSKLRDCARSLGIKKHNVHSYTKEEDEWIKKEYLKFDTSKKAAEAFNEEFGTNITQNGIATHAQFNLKIIKVPKLIYEKANGKIGKNETVLHLDGNKKNNSIDNLLVIDERTRVNMKHSGLLTNDPKVNLVAAKYYELFFKIKERDSIA